MLLWPEHQEYLVVLNVSRSLMTLVHMPELGFLEIGASTSN